MVWPYSLYQTGLHECNETASSIVPSLRVVDFDVFYGYTKYPELT